MVPLVSEKPLDELRRIRRQKLDRLKAQGQEPFAQPQLERQVISFVREQPLAARVRVVGRLRSWRGHGGSIFSDIIDYSGKLQVFFSRQDLGEKYDLLELFDLGDFILVEGELFKTQAGELTLRTYNFQLLTKSLRPLPSSFYGLKDVEERYRQRYVDLLVNENARSKFETRSKIIKELRSILDQEGFWEVETPVLQPLYGGATAKPFATHHQALDADLYLRISDELYLKRLIVGGFEKVYEIGKDFRNEGLDRAHNPEFTMCEFYWAYQTYEGLMTFTEKILTQIIGQVHDSLKVKYDDGEIDFAPPWPRLTYRQAFLEACGLDPDEVAEEESLRQFIQANNLDVDLKGVVGYAPLLDTIYKKRVRPRLRGPLFLVDRPAEMVPLAKRKADDQSKSASFQLVVNGWELINAYDELNDPIEQRSRWEEETRLAERGLEEYQVIDEDYLRALEYGMPPTAGWGLGVDRFVSLLTDSHSIKEVILFPTLRPEISVPQGHPLPSARGGLVEDLPIEAEGDYPSREKVLEFVEEKIQNQNLFRHLLAVEAAMKALARRFGGNEELWGILGLIHDADWEETKSDPNRHTRVILDWLASQGYRDGPLVQALKSHNRVRTGLAELSSVMEWALECCDELAGFIVSVTLVRPDPPAGEAGKKLASVRVEHILKKWKEKSFAAAVNRAQIAQCEENLGIRLEEFISLVLEAMKAISDKIGL